jgi:transcriptional regulator with XRE-family HTH domain
VEVFMSRISAGRKIAGARVEAGLEQGELAVKAGISLHQVGRIERGEVKADPEVVARILAALGLGVGAWWEEWGKEVSSGQ